MIDIVQREINPYHNNEFEIHNLMNVIPDSISRDMLHRYKFVRMH